MKRIKNAAFQRKLNVILTLLFLVQIPVALLTDLKSSVPYVVFLSQWALVASHLTGALAADSTVKTEAQ